MMEEILLLGLKDKQVRPLAPPTSSRSPNPTNPRFPCATAKR
jgi:hypothetical protein